MKILKILLNIGIVKKTCETGEVKVKDYDHITGRYQGLAIKNLI